MWKHAIALLALCASATALKCVQCETKVSAECMDPMNSTAIAAHTRTCGSRQLCRKITFTEGGKDHVKRDCAELAKDDSVGCGWEIRVSSKTGSGWDCFCEEDMCNGAGTAAAGGVLLLVAAALLSGAQ